MKKTSRRILSLCLVLAMMLSLCVTAWADEDGDGDSDASAQEQSVDVTPAPDPDPEPASAPPPDPEPEPAPAPASVPEPEPEPEPERVEAYLDVTTLQMETGDRRTINIRFSSGQSTVKSYQWESGDKTVATISGSGASATVTAVGAGEATVGALLSDADGVPVGLVYCEVTVTGKAAPVSVTGGRSMTMKAGTTEPIRATISGGSGSGYQYDWSYEGDVGITGDHMRGDAQVYAMNAGSGTVTLTVYDLEDMTNYGSTRWTVTVESDSTPLTASVSPSSLTLGAGESKTLTVNASGGSGNNSNYRYNWYSRSTIVSVSGNGQTATVTAAAATGSATVSVDVEDTVTGAVKTVDTPVTVRGGSAVYNASGSASVGTNYPLSTIAGNITSEFRSRFGTEATGSASFRFASPSSSVGTIRAQNGNQIRANESVSYSGIQAVYFLATAAGTFVTEYSLTDGGNTISGTLTITATGGTAVTGASISNTSLEMATYSNRYLSVSVAPTNASYSVSWSSSNTSVAYVNGSGASVTVLSTGKAGSATITATVTGTNGGSFTRNCVIYVSNDSTYNPSLSVTLGSDYYGTSTSDSMIKQFRNVYGVTLNTNDATIRFSSTGNSRYGVMRLANGRAISAGTNYSFTEWIDMYFEPIAAGTFSLPYTLTYRGNVLSGTLSIYIRSANVSATISQTSMTIAPYSNQSIYVNVTPSSAYYRVNWGSTNTNIVTVSGSGDSATIRSSGATGTATVYATVTDRSGVEIYRSCTVTVSNRNNTFNPSVSTTIGVPYRGTGTSDAMKAQFRSVYGVTLPNTATIRFSSTGNNNVAVMRMANGTPIKSNYSYTMAEYIAMYTDPVAAGTFSVPYTLSYNNNSLGGSVIVNVNSGSVTASLSLSSTNPYVFSSSTATGATGSSLLGSAITNALGGSWNYIRFGTTSGTVGTLYKNSSRNSIGSSNIGQSDLGSLYFVPSRSGDYSVSFTIFTASGGTLGTGTLYIRVSGASGGAAFGDVTSGSWYAESVQWAVNREITNGMSRDSRTGVYRFEPETTCNNAQIITFLWRSQGSPLPTISNPFTDVRSTDYFYNAALWAYERGVVSGTTFGEKNPCTRATTVVYMWNLAGRPGADTSTFADLTSGTQVSQAASWAVSRGIVGGTGYNAAGVAQFSPDMICNRGTIVTLLCRAYA